MKDEGGRMKVVSTRTWEAGSHIPGPSPLFSPLTPHHPSFFILPLLLFFLILHSSSFILCDAATLHSEGFDSTSGGYLAIDITSWQWGAPISGPGSAHSPRNCWGTNLSGNYGDSERGALLSPTFDLSAETGNTIELTWWEWLDCEPYFDSAIVEVTNDGGATWELVHAVGGRDGDSWQWRRVVLTDSFATDSFRFRFRFQSDESSTYAGWYVDDVKLESFPADVLLVADFEDGSDLPPDLTMTGAWELGSPVGSIGPAEAHSPIRCLGTDLDAFYGRSQTSSLSFAIPITVDADAEKSICVSWWQYLQLDGFGDHFSVDTSYDGGSTWASALSTDGSGLPARWLAQHLILTHTFTHDPDEPTQYIHLRYRLVTDDAFEQAGAYFDDFAAHEVGSDAVNQPPVFSPDRDSVGLYGEIDDDEVGQEHSFHLNLIGDDPENGVLVWSIASGPGHGSASVTPSGDSALVTYTPPVNWQGTDVLYVRIADPAGLSDTIRVDVEIAIVETVTDDPVDDPPVVANPIPDQSVQEDSAPVDIPLANVFTDPDDDDALIAKQVVGNTNPALVVTSIAHDTLRLTLQPDASGGGTITLRGTSDGEYVDNQFTVTVSAVNDPPLFSLSGDIAVDEDFVGTHTVTASSISPPSDEQGQTVTYSLSPASVAFANVAIDPGSGEVTITAVADGNGEQLFAVIADDGQAQNGLAQETFLLTVNALNDWPAFTLDRTTVELGEDFFGTEMVNAVPDAVSADEVSQVVTYSLAPPSVAFADVAINVSTGQVSITAVANASGTQEFTVTANDGQALNNTDSHSFTLTVDALNDLPVAISQDLETLEDTPIDIVLSGTDVESEDLDIAIGDFPEYGSLTGTPPNVTYTPSQDSVGTYSFTFKVNDGTADSELGTVTIRVGDSDDSVEVANPVVDIAVDEDSDPIQIDVSAVFTDPDGDDSQIVVSVYANTNTGLVDAQLDAGTLTLTLTANGNGSAAITLRGTSGTTRVDDTFTVTVAPLNDPPVNTSAPGLLGTAHPGNTLTVNEGNWNDGNDQAPGQIDLDYQWQRADDALGADLADIADATGTSYAVTADDVGRWLRVRVTGTDNGEGTPASQSAAAFSDWLAVANLPPILDAVGSTVTVDIDEDSDPTAFNLDLTATDADEDGLSWSVSSDPQHGTATLTSVETHVAVGYTPEPDWNGVDQFTVQVEDGFGGSDSVNVEVNVGAVNDPPQFTFSTMALQLDEDFVDMHTVTVMPVAVPADEIGQAVVYSISPESVSFVNIAIDPGTGEIVISSIPNAYGGILFTVTADDGQGTNSTHQQRLLVNVRPMPDVGAVSVSITPLATSDTTPALSGHVSASNATVRVIVEGTTYTATTNTNGTWTLADNAIDPPLTQGVYDVTVHAVDAGGDTGDDGTLNELTIDTVSPTNPYITHMDPRTNTRITDATVALVWGNGWDDLSGIVGYSLLVDGAPDTNPPQTANSTALPSALTIGPPYGRRWLHIDTVDGAGNWAGVQHYGPWLMGSTDAWVGSGGDDAGPGTEGEPFGSIRRGVDAVTIGGTVHVLPGSYSEGVVIDKALHLVGESGSTVLAGTGWGIGLTVAAADVAITGLSLRDYTTGIQVTSDGQAEIHHCSFSGNRLSGVSNLNAAATVNARYNWWGDKSGPSGEGSGTGDAVGTSIDYSPWLGDPDGQMVVVVSEDDLQDAINNCESDGTLMVAPGVYPGPVVIDQSLTIIGAPFSIDGQLRITDGAEVTFSVDVNCDVLSIEGGSRATAVDVDIVCSEDFQIDVWSSLMVTNGSLTINGRTVSGTFIVKDSWGTFTITDDTVFASGSVTFFDHSHISIFNETKHVTVTIAAGADLTVSNGCLIDAVSGVTRGLNYHLNVEDGAAFSMTGSTMKHCGTSGTGAQAGLYVDSADAVIQRNTFTDCYHGLVLGPSSRSCDVWHNHFHANPANARDDSVSGTNEWDDGHWGNAWDAIPGWGDADDDGVGDSALPVPGAAGASDTVPFLGMTNVFLDDDYSPVGPFYFADLSSALGAVAANGTVRAYAGSYGGSGTVTVAGVVLRALENGVSVSGDIAFASPVTLTVDAAPSDVFSISGVMSGSSGIIKEGKGILLLSGANAYTDTTTVSAGVLRLGASNAIPDGSDLILAGTLDVGGNSETVAALTGIGTVTNSAVTAGVVSVGAGGATSAFAGVIEDGVGTVALTKVGGGTFTLTGVCTHTGGTTVSAGTLLVNGSVAASALDVRSGATLSGAGTTGAVTVESAGAVTPGNSTAILSTGTIGFSAGAVFSVEINGPVAGVEHDQLNVTGTVSLSSASLYVFAGFLPVPGDESVVINNDGADTVVGTFAGLPEGALVLGGSADFYITYGGGDGNDVGLVAAPPTVVYADDSWATVPPGEDPDGSGPAIAFGIDAFATIQDAVNGVRDQGTVYVHTGIYNENVNVAHGMTIAAVDGAQEPVLQGPGTGIGVSVSAPDVTVTGLIFDSFATDFSSTSGGTINDCRFSGTTMGVAHTGAAMVDARHNWWGHSSGPSGPGHDGHGSGMSVNVDFRPWRGDAAGTVEYHYHVPVGGSIQGAINSSLVPTGGGIIVDAGTYVEDLIVGKPVFIDAVTTFTVDGDVTFDAEPVLITGAALANPGTDPADDAWRVTINGQIADACLAANTGETVWVQDGTHTLKGQIVIENKDINVLGVDPDTSIVDGDGQYRGFMLTNAAGTVIEDLTIQDCVANDGVPGPGGAVYSDAGGTVRFCKILGNTATEGGGVYLGAGGTLRNLLIEANVATERGGGVYILDQGLIESCTIVGNSGVHYAASEGGGVYLEGAATVLNTIIYYNEAVVGENYVHGGAGTPTYLHSCTTPAVGGATNISDEPLFRAAGDYTLEYWDGAQHLSPCLDVGLNQGWMAGEIDLLGEDRIINGTVDMGALECTYEDQPGSFEEPDFVIRRIILDPPRPGPGSTFTAYVQVKNMGRNPLAPGWIGITTGSGGGVNQGWFRIRTLQVGESQTATFPYLTAGAPPEHVTVFVDTGDETEEESEGNNTFSVPYP